MEPASSIINALGGPAIVARVAGVHRTRVFKWRWPRERGGTDGTIPSRHIPALLSYAKTHEIALSLNDFFPSPETGAAAT